MSHFVTWRACTVEGCQLYSHACTVEIAQMPMAGFRRGLLCQQTPAAKAWQCATPLLHLSIWCARSSPVLISPELLQDG